LQPKLERREGKVEKKKKRGLKLDHSSKNDAKKET